MAYQWATWIGTVLRAAKIPVVEHAGWTRRGRPGGVFTPRYVVWHHDGSPAGSSPTVDDFIIRGTDTTPGPLAQLWVCRGCRGAHPVGTWHVLAAGRANHAGAGGPYMDVRRDDMNSHSLGVEVDQTAGEAWDTRQLASLEKGTAALLRHMRRNPNPYLLFHKTWAPGRKADPWGLSLSAERVKVTKALAPPPAPPKPPAPVAPTLKGEVPVLIQDPLTTDIYLIAGGAMVLCDVETRSNAAKVGVLPFRVSKDVYARLVRELGPVIR